jgi:site-specific recombinase XerD
MKTINTSEKRFKMAKFRFETDAGEYIDRHMITDNLLPMCEINQWIEMKSLRSPGTGRDYASKLVVFLNYLDHSGIEYQDAGNKHVLNFIHNLIYGDLISLTIKSPATVVSYSTLIKYIAVITGFYRWLDNNVGTNMQFGKKANPTRAKKSFLYGQIYTYEYLYLIDGVLPQLKGKHDYAKWYTQEDKQRLLDGLLSLRDKAVFLLTLEGFRIDEVLSMTLDSYNVTNHMIQPTRSKGKPDARLGSNHLRTVALPAETCEIINRYIETERTQAENESCRISQNLFINVNRGVYQGKPLMYSNYIKCLKRGAERVGMNPARIRTHNGRSTKAMEYLEHQALHPEDGITDVLIAESFGWNSIDSIRHYRDHNNQVIAKSVNDKLRAKRRCHP